MAFWSSETFQQQGELQSVVSPFSSGRISRGAYELSLGKEAYSTSSKDGTKTILKEGEQFVIPPGQFAMLLTEEVVKIPNNAIGLISIKAGIKFRGLVNVSGFHVDPGFAGRLKFSVYNAGSKNIILTSGTPVFLLWLNKLDASTGDLYPSSKVNSEITAEDVMNIQGEVASPGELKCAIDALRQQLKSETDSMRDSVLNFKWAVALVFALMTGLIIWLITKIVDIQAPPKQPEVFGVAEVSRENAKTTSGVSDNTKPAMRSKK